MRSKLLISSWEYANFLVQLVFSKEPNIYHLRIFKYLVYVPIALPQTH